MVLHWLAVTLISTQALAAGPVLPGPTDDGVLLPNGWRITPFGDVVHTEDLITNLVPTPDGRNMVGVHSGWQAHGMVVIDAQTHEAVQRIPLPTTWYGMTWSPDGAKLYVSGGNNKSREGTKAPIYIFDYENGRLSGEPVSTLEETVDQMDIYWSALVHHPTKPLLFAANRTAGNIVVFDTETGKLQSRIDTEVNPYDLALTVDGKTLYCSNWASDSVSVIDCESLAVTATIAVGDNPNDIVLSKDGRLFVACSNDNTVYVVDTEKGRPTEVLNTAMYAHAPEGSTPNFVVLDSEEETLYVANADNNNVCVIDVEEAGECAVLGFIPAGWYPSALAIGPDGETLYIGNGKGGSGSANVHGPKSPLGRNADGKVESTKSTVHGTINIVSIPDNKRRLRELTEQCYANSPYNDDLLAKAKVLDTGPSVVPSVVGAGSAIKHVIYIIKENRTYDQVLGDLEQGNGDPRLTLFGREVTPNHHKIAEDFVLFDNLYCDAEVSRDGHAWSNAAYATDFVEKVWPASYGGKSDAPYTEASVPASGYLWDLCATKGLTYRTYGEFARRVSEGGPMEGRAPGLVGHTAPNYLNWGARDTENAKQFILEFDEYESNYESDDPNKRLPNFIVMGLPEDHTKGTRPGVPTPRAAVASNDAGLGMIIERVTHSRYWPETAIFVIQDDSQDGPDHVDARRTVGFVISSYAKRKYVDSTFYTTSSMIRTMELLLGLPPMSQYDAAANPMYAAFSMRSDETPYDREEPRIDLNETNARTAWGAEKSIAMDLSNFDLAPMFVLNEILWKNAHGADSEMPLPVHRFAAGSLR